MAKRRLRDEADAFDEQSRAVRDRAASVGCDTVGSVALTSLGEAAIERMAIDWFSTVAADAEQRVRMAVPPDRDEALFNPEQDEAALNGPSDLGLGASYSTAVRLLQANDVRLLRRPLSPIRVVESPLRFAVSREDAVSLLATSG